MRLAISRELLSRKFRLGAVVRHSHDSFQLVADSISFSNAIHQNVESYQTADHHCYWQGILGYRPRSKRPKQPSQVHAELLSLGDSSCDETGRSVILSPKHAEESAK